MIVLIKQSTVVLARKRRQSLVTNNNQFGALMWTHRKKESKTRDYNPFNKFKFLLILLALRETFRVSINFGVNISDVFSILAESKTLKRVNNTAVINNENCLCFKKANRMT